MPASSLHDACKRQAIRMISQIDDFGTMPFRLVKPILVRVQNAEQLYRIEQNSPQLVGETRELWLELIKRDVPNWQSKPHEPKNPASWYKIYRKLVKESDKEVDEDALILQATLKNLEDERLKRTSKFVDPRTVPLPNARGRGARFPFKKGVPQKPSDLRFTSGSKTKMVSGKDVIERARREARERSHFIGGKSLLARPTHELNNSATTISRAPTSLVEQHRRPESGAGNHSGQVKIIAPRRPSGTQTSASSLQIPHKLTREEREARLKAIAAGKPPPAAESSSTSLKSRPAPSNSPPRPGLSSTIRPSAPSPSRLPPSSQAKPPGSKSSSHKRKRDTDEIDAPDDLFDHTPGAASEAAVDDDLFDRAEGKAAGTSERKKQASPPTKRRRSNSPPARHAADGRPRAFVQKAPVDIFMKRERRAR